MGIDDGESWWEVEGELRVVSDRVEVEGGNLQCLDVRVDGLEDGWVERCSDQDESVRSEYLVFDCPRLKRLWLC